jgi:hypothetical protein
VYVCNNAPAAIIETTAMFIGFICSLTPPFSGSGVFRRDPLEWLVGRHTNGTEQQHALRSY